MSYSNIPSAQTVVQLCKLYSIKHIVISPGSRNAPLIIGFTNDDYFKCYSIVDERAAAFFAMGIAQQTRHPAALVCTSGSAVLNYYPAISEAFYSNIPLVVLSADRPDYLVDIGDGQTIRQQNVFGSHVAFSTSLELDIRAGSMPSDKIPQEDIQEVNEGRINAAIETSINQSAPVHINIPFSEPLYQTSEKFSVRPHKIATTDKELPNYTEIGDCIQKWKGTDRHMILCGVMYPGEIEEQYLKTLSEDESVLVFTETTSNVNYSETFPSIDKIIAPLEKEEFEQLRPQILITMGGMLVSKKIKAFLRQHPPIEHWHVGEFGANDTFFTLTKVLKMSPNQFFSKFLWKIDNSGGDYKKKWNLVKDLRLVKHNRYLKKIPFSDLKAFEIILDSVPNDIILQIGNSASIRYSQLFDLKNTLEVYCNRGTSGIDGSTSTAIGCAVAREKQTVLICGDLSFFYDSNALWNNYIPSSFRIIVLNNSGGGIFRILPGDKANENFESYFETIHDLDASNLCNMFNFDYYEATTEESLAKKLRDFYTTSERPRLLEIFTPRKKNDKILLDYFEFLK